MEVNNSFIKNLIMMKKDCDIIETINTGWDPNVGGGWPIRLAARYGCCSTVETLIKYGANPHLLSDSGASTLQLAVYSGEHWESDRWSFLLSCCDSSQLADGAAVAIVFSNCAALTRILQTGRCNAHIPTTLTGKTLEELAKGYKLTHLLNPATIQIQSPVVRIGTSQSPRIARAVIQGATNTLTPQQPARNLSPSVARFFQQTSSQSSLTSPQRQFLEVTSPTTQFLN